jgi:vacuolar-type H+-ATPase subunit H
VDLQQEQVNLQRDQIEFNKSMWLANTIINGTQAAVSLTKAAVGLGQTIGEYHDQQANLSIQTNATQYQAGVTEAITNGYDPYVVETGENGQQIRRYIGYDNYTLSDGTKLGELKQQAVQTVGNKYWTKSGADQGMQIATNAFENIELAAQRQTADAVIKNRQNVFSQELTNAINTYRQNGDATQLNTVIDSATWMSPDQKQATALEAERQARYGNVQQTALETAKTQGISETEKYLNGITDLTAEDKSKILSEAQQANNQAVTASVEAAKEKYQQSIQGGSTIGNAYRAAIAGQGDNPTVNETIKKAAQAAQFESLSDRFGKDMAGVDGKTTQ